MVQSESVIFTVSGKDTPSLYSNPVLLIETETSRLYRVSRDGKYYILKTARIDSDRNREILRREYEMSIKLSHPHVAYIFSYERETPMGEGILMEYIEGRTLTEFLAESPSKTQRERVLGQLLDAVSYIHKKGLRHNDLKPRNILITYADNDLKLIDFGLSDDDAHYALKVLGCTPSYASPELLAHGTELDVRSDIYSLGKILSELLGGRYRRITKKCSHSQTGRRYRSIDEIRNAINLHKRIPYIILVIFLTILAGVFVTKFAILKSDFDTISRQQAQEMAFRDSVFTLIDAEISHAYDSLDVQISQIPDMYNSFAALADVMNNLQVFYKSVENITEDPALRAEFWAYFQSKQRHRYDAVCATIEQKDLYTAF